MFFTYVHAGWNSRCVRASVRDSTTLFIWSRASIRFYQRSDLKTNGGRDLMRVFFYTHFHSPWRPLSETFFLSVPQFHLPLKIRKLDARWYLGTRIIWRIAPGRAYFSILADFPLLSTGTAVPWQTAAASRWWASSTWRTFQWGSSRFQ